VYVPRGVAERKQLAAAIARVSRKLGTDVIRLRYSVQENWSGEPSIYFRVVLTDQASKPPRLHKVAKKVEAIIEEQINPLHSWGLFSYYNFRSKSEQDDLKEPAWA